MIYPITLYGDSVLRTKADEIVEGEIDVKQLAEDMFETMHSADGIGLAAPQIGISKRIFVIDGSMLEDEQMKSFKQWMEEVGDREAEQERLKQRQRDMADREKAKIDQIKQGEKQAKDIRTNLKSEIKQDLEDAMRKSKQNKQSVLQNFIDDPD